MIAFEKYIGKSELGRIKEEFTERVINYIQNKQDYFSKCLKKNVMLIDGDLRATKEKAGELKKAYNVKKELKLKNSAKKIYEGFMNCNDRKRYADKNGYWLCKALGIDICPYCNRQYTFTVTADKVNITRPTFDHFLPQSKYPLLALSFYNLIPSCSICNQRKSNKIFDFYPYTGSFHENMRFDIQEYDVDIFSDKRAEFEIKLNKKNNTELALHAQKDASKLRIDAIYNLHKDYAREIILKAAYYNESSLKLIRDAFGNEFDNEFIAQMYFGNYLDENGIMKRPLSKLTLDIIEQFNGKTICKKVTEEFQNG